MGGMVEPGGPAGAKRGPLALTYAAAADVRRDRLPDVRRGVIARVPERLAEGDEVTVALRFEREGLTVAAIGRVRWATPLARACLVGLELAGATHRDDVQLDLLFGLRAAGGGAAGSRAAAPERALPIALLQPSAVLGGVVACALRRFAREQGWDLRLEVTRDGAALLAALSARPPRLVVVDCDRAGGGVDPLLDAIRAHGERARLPVVLLSAVRSPRLEDPRAVTLGKPVAMKALVHTVDLLLRG
jgi:CheY-like chemotaxis protein